MNADRNTTMECNDARALIPSYIDGELSSTQSGVLRKHLLDCQPCRASAQDVKNLKRWFVEPAAVAVPDGFAARVARRAFAGDTGFSGQTGELQPAFARGAAAANEPRQLRFVLILTTAAAVFLIALSLAFQNIAVPHGGKLMADDGPGLERALRDLDRLNHPTRTLEAPLTPPVPARGVVKQP